MNLFQIFTDLFLIKIADVIKLSHIKSVNLYSTNWQQTLYHDTFTADLDYALSWIDFKCFFT